MNIALESWVSLSCSLGSHIRVTLMSPAGSTAAPAVTIELGDSEGVTAERWEYIPPHVGSRTYAPRWLITHDWIRVSVDAVAGWDVAAEVVPSITNADGRPSVLNPLLSSLGQAFDSLCYAGAHGGPVVTGNGEPAYRYRFSNVADERLVDWNPVTGRVDIHADGFRAHSVSGLHFLTPTPANWDRGSGTLYALVRHHEDEDSPGGISRHARWDNNNHRWHWIEAGKWGLEIGNKIRTFSGVDEIRGYNQVSTLTVRWSPDQYWELGINGAYWSADPWDVSGANMPGTHTEFLSNGQVVRLVCIAFGLSRGRLSDELIAQLHADPYAWAE